MGFDLEILWQQLISPAYLLGALVAIGVATLALILSLALGYFVAIGRGSRVGGVRLVSGVYSWIFRAIPALLVLLVVWNALPQLMPALRAEWYTPFWAAVLGLALVEAAYMAEIVRSALLAVDDGQTMAGRAMGMRPSQITMRIVLPQAFRIAIPPISNEFISLIKFTSLASVISLRELMSVASAGVSTTFRYAEYYTAAAIYYLVIVSILMLVQRQLERRFTWSSKVKRGLAARLRSSVA